MKQVVILSGKGGTGKTTLASAFADLAAREFQISMADLDVDASNLELLVQPQIIEKHLFYAGKTAFIDDDLCIQCGECLEACRFGAVHHEDSRYSIDEGFCEGCLSCVYRCPVEAIGTKERLSGEWYQSRTPYGALFHARLIPGAENSGKLVTQVKSSAADHCQSSQCDLLLLDGPPGIGCPVTASIRGVDFAVLVSEPTPSGLHDLERIIQVTQHFQIPACLVLNKSDLNLEIRGRIMKSVAENQLPILGEIPYDESIITSQSQAKPLTEVSESAATDAIRAIWQRLKLETGLLPKGNI